MGRIALAFKLFFRTLGNADFAQRARSLFTAAPEPTRIAPVHPAQPTTTRSDAITLLAVLQRESRLIDFLKEEITAYQDAQIGADVRDVPADGADAWQEPAFLESLIPAAQSVLVGDGGRSSVNFRLSGR